MRKLSASAVETIMDGVTPGTLSIVFGHPNSTIDYSGCYIDGVGYSYSVADARFFIWARDAVPEMVEEITRLRTALATAEKERDAAHNEALEKAAEAVRDIWTPYKRVDLTEVLNLIRALKKETPNADK